MGILNFTILSLGLIFFIKILLDICLGMINQYNDCGSIDKEKKRDAIVVGIGLVFTMMILLSADSFAQGDIGIITILLTPITYSVYKGIKAGVSYLKNRESKVYDIKDKAKGWKVVPYGGKRVSDFRDRNELEIYRVHTLIKNVLSNNYGYIVNVESNTSISVRYDDLAVEITLEVLNGKVNRRNRIGWIKNKLRKEGKFYCLLKKELLPYTHMIDGSVLKLGNDTLIMRVDHCDIKLNIKKSA